MFCDCGDGWSECKKAAEIRPPLAIGRGFAQSVCLFPDRLWEGSETTKRAYNENGVEDGNGQELRKQQPPQGLNFQECVGIL